MFGWGSFLGVVATTLIINPTTRPNDASNSGSTSVHLFFKYLPWTGHVTSIKTVFRAQGSLFPARKARAPFSFGGGKGTAFGEARVKRQKTKEEHSSFTLLVVKPA